MSATIIKTLEPIQNLPTGFIFIRRNKIGIAWAAGNEDSLVNNRHGGGGDGSGGSGDTVTIISIHYHLSPS